MMRLGQAEQDYICVYKLTLATERSGNEEGRQERKEIN